MWVDFGAGKFLVIASPKEDLFFGSLHVQLHAVLYMFIGCCRNQLEHACVFAGLTIFLETKIKAVYVGPDYGPCLQFQIWSPLFSVEA